MNRPIRTVAIGALVMFLALLLNASYLQYYQADSLNKNGLNRRVIEAAFGRERGAILVGRETIAVSEPTGDGRYPFQRKYPQGELYAHETGFFSFYSQSGLERTQNEVLSGDDPRLFVTRLTDLLSQTEPKGGQVQITIDPAAQKAAYDGLKALGSKVEGSVVAIQPSTGKILAMVSLPSYDPNLLASHDLNEVGAADKKLQTDPTQPLINRAIGTRLPPGSTFKVLTAAAAIETGKYTADSQVPGGSTYKIPNSTKVIGNEGRDCGTKTIPFTQAMENSCNTSFLALADEVGSAGMIRVADRFGFNATNFDDLPNAAMSQYPEMDRALTAISGIGQASVTATPLQMAMVVAGIANNGVVMKPYLVDRVTSPDLQVLDQTKPEELPDQPAVKPATASEVTKLLVATVEQGTATPAQIPGVKVAGKTGTAQSGLESHPAPYAWFVSFAPADTPEVAVAVMLQSVGGLPTDEIHGGTLGGPIAKAVMEAVLNR